MSQRYQKVMLGQDYKQLDTKVPLLVYDAEQIASDMFDNGVNALLFTFIDLRIAFNQACNLSNSFNRADVLWSAEKGFHVSKKYSKDQKAHVMGLGIIEALISLDLARNLPRAPNRAFFLNMYDLVFSKLLQFLGEYDIKLVDIVRWSKHAVRCAKMSHAGIPLNEDRTNSLKAKAARIINKVKQGSGLFHEDGEFNYKAWDAVISKLSVAADWPKSLSGEHFSKDLEILCRHRELAVIDKAYKMFRLIQSLSVLQKIAGDTQHPRYQPFGTSTSRNAHITSGFIPGNSKWMRALIEPREGEVLIEFDFHCQEFLINAYLSGDTQMLADYASGDIYQKLADELVLTRDVAKELILGISYGMGRIELARRLGPNAAKIETKFWQRYYKFLAFRKGLKHSWDSGRNLRLESGWARGSCCRFNTYMNFLSQGTGADILRKCLASLQNAGYNVVFTVHDSLVVSCSESAVESVVPEITKILVDKSYPEMRVQHEIIRHGETWNYKNSINEYNALIQEDL